VPVPVPTLPLQLVHEQDMGQALLWCVMAAGPPGAYNIAADGIVRADGSNPRTAYAISRMHILSVTGPALVASRAEGPGQTGQNAHSGRRSAAHTLRNGPLGQYREWTKP